MKVAIINNIFSNRPINTLIEAIGICYDNTKDITNTNELDRLLTDVIQRGHLSVFEHISMTFKIEGISRVTSHQLVRHRIASFTQESQRYTTQKNAFILPESIKNEGLEETLNIISDLYNEMVKKGYPKEDVRYILPQAFTTNIIMTMNVRELFHFFSLRLCNRAQKEIRELAGKMLNECLNYYPIIFKHAGKPCVTKGVCPEGKYSCKVTNNHE